MDPYWRPRGGLFGLSTGPPSGILGAHLGDPGAVDNAIAGPREIPEGPHEQKNLSRARDRSRDLCSSASGGFPRALLKPFLGLLWGRRERRRRLRERPSAPQERSNGGPKRHKYPASDGGGRGLMPPFFDRRPPTLPKKPSRAPWRTPRGPQGGPPRELRCGLKHVLKYPRIARRGSPKPVISPVGIPASLRAFPGCSSKQLSWASFRNGLAGARSVNNCLKMAASKCDGPTETLLCVRACPPMPFHVPHPSSPSRRLCWPGHDRHLVPRTPHARPSSLASPTRRVI